MGQAAPKMLLDFSTISRDEAWYTVVTKFNYEVKFVSELLKKLAQNQHLLEDFVDLFIPEKKCTIEYLNAQGKLATRIITDKTMSLYVFIKVKMSEDLYWLLKDINGCSTLLATGNSLTTIPEDEVLKYRNDADIKEDTFKGFKIISKINPFYNPISTLKGHIDQQETISLKKESFLETKDEINVEKTFKKKRGRPRKKLLDETIQETQPLVDKQEIITLKDKKKFDYPKKTEPITNLKDTIENDQRDLSVKRTKAEGLPNLNEINPHILLRKLKKLGLMDKFMKLGGKDVSFLSNIDLSKLQGTVKQAQVKEDAKALRNNKQSNKLANFSKSIKPNKQVKFNKSFNKNIKVSNSGNKQSQKQFKQFVKTDKIVTKQKGKFDPQALINSIFAPYKKSKNNQQNNIKKNINQKEQKHQKHQQLCMPYMIIHQKHQKHQQIVSPYGIIHQKHQKKQNFKQSQSKNNWKTKKQNDNYQTKSSQFKNNQMKNNQKNNQYKKNNQFKKDQSNKQVKQKHQKLCMPYMMVHQKHQQN